MAEEKHGTDMIRKGYALIIEVANVWTSVTRAKKWYEKLLAFGPIIDELVAMIGFKPGLFLKEWNEYSPEERKADLAWACEKFDLADDTREEQFEAALILLKKGAEWVERVMKYVNGLKKK